MRSLAGFVVRGRFVQMGTLSMYINFRDDFISFGTEELGGFGL